MPTVAVERRLDTFKDEYVMTDKNENYKYIYIKSNNKYDQYNP